VPFAAIAAAKLVLTDELLARGRPRHEQATQERHGTRH